MPERGMESLRMMGWGLLVVESSSAAVVVAAAAAVAPLGVDPKTNRFAD